MDGILVFMLFLALVFGAGMLMLFMGYTEIEKKRAEERKEQQPEALPVTQAVASVPRFFAKPELGPFPAQAAIDGRLIVDLQNYVKAEQAMVNRFVNEPSVDSLYRQPTLSIHVN